MLLFSREGYELMAQFERDFKIDFTPFATKEYRSIWPAGNFYCHGPTNEKFLAYRKGYAYAKHLFQNHEKSS
jgi:hypothetical protein